MKTNDAYKAYEKWCAVNNKSGNFEDLILEFVAELLEQKPGKQKLIKPIEKELYAVERYAERIKKIHMSYEYYMRIQASDEKQEITEKIPGKKVLMGFPVVVHSEPCEKDFWLETVL